MFGKVGASIEFDETSNTISDWVNDDGGNYQIGLVASLDPEPMLNDIRSDGVLYRAPYTYYYWCSTDDYYLSGDYGTAYLFSNLNSEKNYYVRPYMKYEDGIMYGKEVVLNAAPGIPATCGALNVHNSNKTYGTLTDIEGNTYKTIVIGTQEWMAENLNTSKYNNGAAIQEIDNNNGESGSNESWVLTATGAFTGSSSACPFGKLYNWQAVSSDLLCPAGWHVPDNDEWNTLADYLGGATNAGDKLKSSGSYYWYNADELANEVGFSALSGGVYEINLNNPNLVSTYCYTSYYKSAWWSATQYNASEAWYREIEDGNTQLQNGRRDKNCGLSVRCVKN